MHSTHGLLTTVAYKLGSKAPAVYALEGSVAVAGAAVRWLRDNLKMLSDVSMIAELAAKAPASGHVVFVPAFAGLFAPYWRNDARGYDKVDLSGIMTVILILLCKLKRSTLLSKSSGINCINETTSAFANVSNIL